MSHFKELMEHQYLQYASYVILDRAIPNIVDGLKPVHRRILHTLYKIDDGKFHKVANVSGQTMAYHPHGDAPINDALIHLANKRYLLETQGNFGNPLTGDPAAAPRYIETKLSSLARETLFNPSLTDYVPSYDGRNQEPVCLPAKIPLLLMQGADGIAVGMATRILPHNFCELLEAEIALLKGEKIKVLPDFPGGGIMDASEYDDGRGKVRLRAKLDLVDSKTIVIREVCYGTTTDSLIRSVEEASRRGKIKIDSIHDYTADRVEIEIKLPRGQYAQDIVDALYAYTDCEVSLNTHILVIKDQLPWQATVTEALQDHIERVQGYLKQELILEAERLELAIFNKTLERLFIEHRLYKKIEEIKDYPKIHDTVARSLKPFHKELPRIPEEEDRERLLNLPLRRISRFDIEKNLGEIDTLAKSLEQVQKHLKRIKQFTIQYLKGLLKKYGDLFPRRTETQSIETIDRRVIEEREVEVGYDRKKAFIGTAIPGAERITCSSLDKLLIVYEEGFYRVINIPEKLYLEQEGHKVAYLGVADKKSVLSLVYRETKSNYAYAKRFIVAKYILEKNYRFIPEGAKLDYLTTHPSAVVKVRFKPAPKQRVNSVDFRLQDVAVKGVAAKGVRIASKPVSKVALKKLEEQPELWEKTAETKS